MILYFKDLLGQIHIWGHRNLRIIWLRVFILFRDADDSSQFTWKDVFACSTTLLL